MNLQNKCNHFFSIIKYHIEWLYKCLAQTKLYESTQLLQRSIWVIRFLSDDLLPNQKEQNILYLSIEGDVINFNQEVVMFTQPYTEIRIISAGTVAAYVS